jgi:hypothetical protein
MACCVDIFSAEQVWFAMQGEMSATVMRHPRSWTALIPRIKADIVAGLDDAGHIMPNLKVRHGCAGGCCTMQLSMSAMPPG